MQDAAFLSALFAVEMTALLCVNNLSPTGARSRCLCGAAFRDKAEWGVPHHALFAPLLCLVCIRIIIFCAIVGVDINICGCVAAATKLGARSRFTNAVTHWVYVIEDLMNRGVSGRSPNDL